MEIPSTIIDAALGLLRPYFPSLTAERLMTLSEQEGGQKARLRKDDFFSRAEAMEALHCGATTLYRYEKAGRLRVFRPTKRKSLIYKSSIERLMEEQG